MKLAVISHTEHYRDAQGRIVGWGPTVRELNHLLELFEEIWHVAVLHEGEAPPSALPYASGRIRFVPIPPFGGPGLSDKLGVLRRAPQVIRTVREVLRQVDVWQFRAPAGIGVFLIPWLTFCTRKPGWYKYAGNWAQEKAPLGYRWQRFWLARLQRRKVTLNGRWPGQPAHGLSFENPCLDEEERRMGAAALAQKDYAGPLHICFVGHLNLAKGTDKLLEALPQLPPERTAALHLVGDGPLRGACEAAAQQLAFPLILHGYLDRAQVGEIMAASHLLVLPSRSEGFPKVVAEAANYGCVPVVSDVSAIGQYIRHGKNGFLLAPERLAAGLLAEDLQAVLAHPDLKAVAGAAYEMAGDFTFERYRERVGFFLEVEKWRG